MDPVWYLEPHLPDRFRFCEPCAANGQMIDNLRRIGGTCVDAIDINPGRCDIRHGDALRWTYAPRLYREADFIITNPPWTRRILHKLILSFSWQMPTWLLFDADWIHTDQSEPFQPFIRKYVSVGRVKWIEGSDYKGKDNVAWYFMDRHNPGPTELFGKYERSDA